MEYVQLGNTGLRVSKLCFGALTIGPLQANLPVQQGAEVMAEAFRRGINFVDTSEFYNNYPYIKQALKMTNKDIVVCTKTYAYDLKGAKASVEKARKELDRDVIDIFMLHEQESALTLRGHREALNYFFDCKAKGIIKAVGVSTHHIAAVKAVCDIGYIDVIFPIVNYKGLGIVDGSLDQMLDAVKRAYNMGMGVYAMKPLGGGNLIHDYNRCMDYVLSLPYIHSIAMGMQSIEEVIANINYVEGKETNPDILEKVKNKKRSLHISDWCEGCGACVNACKQNALYIKDSKAHVIEDRCILCGYCAGHCKNFAIKVV